MEILIGVALALAVGIVTSLVGFDRDRAFYPTVTIVIASYYVLFAAIAGASESLSGEALVAFIFICIAVAGFKTSLWLVVFALTLHGTFDFFHAQLILNPGVPGWWPDFCLAVDVTLAAWLGCLLHCRRAEDSAAGAG